MPVAAADFLPRGGASKHGASMAEAGRGINSNDATGEADGWVAVRRWIGHYALMEIMLLRHAQPRWALDGGALDSDPELTELGLEQADSLAAALLADLGHAPENTRLLVSPLRRTRQTAAPIAERLGLQVEIRPWLAEIRLPMETMTAAELGSAMLARRHLPPSTWWAGWQGGELPVDFVSRIRAGLVDELAAVGGARVANSPFFDEQNSRARWIISGHGGTNATLIGELLGLTPVPWPWERFVLGHASVSRLRSRAIAGHRLFGVHGCNDCSHLEPSKRSV